LITVHLIGNAHLDPVWLWRWKAGVGEAIATCRSAADRIEEYPDFIFTRSDMWVYEQVENLDSDLFERIRQYVKDGKWQIVGGWYIQPDCNLPTAESFRKHISISKAYFLDRFGVDITVGYNVDSFGHNAMIPSFLKEGGYDSYVMMRPMAHEKELPSALFRWRSPNGAEVLVWRIPRAYTTGSEDLTEHIKASLDVANPEIGHVMCFYGVGDHGGGPTKRQIEWILANQDSIPDVKLIFSHPRAFFDAVKIHTEKLPIVDDELQYHAIGCYTVVHSMKAQMRKTEHALMSAEITAKTYPEDSPNNTIEKINEAWKKPLFNQFHDIYAGTSLASAYNDTSDQLGYACDVANNIINDTHFRRMRKLPDDKFQRIVVFNTSDHDFKGYIQHDPWMNWGNFNGYLADEIGQPVQYQRIQHESVTRGDQCMIWYAEIPAKGERIYQLRTDQTQKFGDSDLTYTDDSISNSYWHIKANDDGAHLLHLQRISDKNNLLKPHGIEVINQYDNSDTWSHGISGFNEYIAGKFRIRKVVIEETGPLRASLRISTSYHESQLDMWVRLYKNDPRIEINLWMNWRQNLQICKLVMPFEADILERFDGIPDGFIRRPQNKQEFPIMDWTLLNMEDGKSLGIICPDCFGLDGVDNALRFTLLRSPAYAWHDPRKLDPKAFYRWTDQSEHGFRFIIVDNATPELLKNMALSEHRQPICYDWTKGMQ
jgi:alpha-mannosidase